MNESLIEQNESVEAPVKPKKRSILALLVFLFAVLVMPACLLLFQQDLWGRAHVAVLYGYTQNLVTDQFLPQVVLAAITIIFTAALWIFTKDVRFRPVYRGWFIAALVALPASVMRLLGTNNDLPGTALQVLICAIAAMIVTFVRKGKIVWGSGNISLAFCLAAFGAVPFALFGAFGSPSDAFLSLLAGLALGWLAALLMETTTGNKLLDVFGIGALLALFASALGYDGTQLILLLLLPAFSFAIRAVLPSRSAATLLTGLVAAAGLAFFDPTEFTLMLGERWGMARFAVPWAVGLGLAVGLIAWIARMLVDAIQRRRTNEPVRTTGSHLMGKLGAAGALAVWGVVITLFFVRGNPGFYGDRLFVILKNQSDLTSVRQIKDIDERRTAAYQALTQKANETQADIRRTFDTFGVAYTPYYLVNALEVGDGLLTRLYLMTRPEVDRIISSPHLRPAATEEAFTPEPESPPPGVQWNVARIGADKVWDEFGVRGKGIVIGQSDTGVDGNHPALRDSYRGKTEGNDYNWFDPWYSKPSPYDNDGHGTHTLGTVLGKYGIGVAPEATWFACANLPRNLGNPAFYLDCMQFMLAPFPQGGDPLKDGDPTRAADVLNNSWGCPEIEGCDPQALLYAANHLRDAGIFVVASAGNDGPRCNTVNSPLPLYDSVFSVGSIDQDGNVSEFSSRGPVTADGSQRMKPDLVAPGENILSARPGGTYFEAGGTSMAGPHVAGVVALLWSADPSLIGDIERTEQILIETAQPYTGQQDDGCFEGSTPNAAYGYGIVDVYAAVTKALGK
jgi:hypothetical protein